MPHRHGAGDGVKGQELNGVCWAPPRRRARRGCAAGKGRRARGTSGAASAAGKQRAVPAAEDNVGQVGGAPGSEMVWSP